MGSTIIVSFIELEDAVEQSLDPRQLGDGVGRILVEVEVVAPGEAGPEEVFEVGLGEALQGFLEVVERAFLGFGVSAVPRKQLLAVVLGSGVEALGPGLGLGVSRGIAAL